MFTKVTSTANPYIEIANVIYLYNTEPLLIFLPSFQVEVAFYRNKNEKHALSSRVGATAC